MTGEVETSMCERRCCHHEHISSCPQLFNGGELIRRPGFVGVTSDVTNSADHSRRERRLASAKSMSPLERVDSRPAGAF
jgi:hypothetical protein